MKRYVTLGNVSTLFVLMLLVIVPILIISFGEKYSYEETEFEAIVIQCEEGTLNPDASFLSIANMYLAQQNYGMWNTYNSLAYSNGTYDYNVTVNIDGNNYTVVRENPYEIGQYITITEVKTYMDSQLVKTEYK